MAPPSSYSLSGVSASSSPESTLGSLCLVPEHLQMPVRGLPFQVLASLDALADVFHWTVPAWDVPLVEHLQMPVRGLPFQVLASWDVLSNNRPFLLAWHVVHPLSMLS